MKRILINGTNSKTGGGKSILNNYLSLLRDHHDGNKYYLVCPNEIEYKKYENEKLVVLKIPQILKINISFPILYYYYLQKLIRKYSIDIVFNHGDIPLPVNIKQIYIFDWPYAVYPDSVVWKKMDFASWVIRKAKLFFFLSNIKFPSKIVAQSPTMKGRLNKLYSLENVFVVPNAVSLDNFSDMFSKNFDLPKDKIRLLYLTHYYPHKNLEILIPLAIETKKRGLTYVFVITLDNEQHKGARKFLDTIKREKLEDIIFNIGPVQMQHVPSLYKQCDALLMPTLLESFSGTYVEAMYHGLPIFTSDFDFAKDVCNNSAYYFDPLDHKAILKTLVSSFTDKENMLVKVSSGKRRLTELPNWHQAFDRYQELLLN